MVCQLCTYYHNNFFVFVQTPSLLRIETLLCTVENKITADDYMARWNHSMYNACCYFECLCVSFIFMRACVHACERAYMYACIHVLLLAITARL